MSSHYSINRVKRVLRHADRFNTARAARLRMRCKQWLGAWGWSGVQGQDWGQGYLWHSS